MAKIRDLKAAMADNALKGVPGCKYLLTRRIRELESLKAGLKKGPSMATIACLHHKLRLERLTNVNERDIARAQYSKAERKKAMQKLLKAQIKKRMWKRKMNMKAKKELIMKGGTCFTTDELGNCPVGQKKHLSYKTYNARMECLERVRCMAPELPPQFLGHNWTVRAMAYCRRCAFSWGTSTGGKFKDEINLVVASLGTHYGGYERVEADRTPQDKDFLKHYLIKKDNPDAFLEFVQQMRKWIPQSRTHCAT